MTVHTFQAKKTAAKAGAAIELKPAYFKVDYDQNTVAFSPEGAAYYRAWFGRFGFRLDTSDARAFFEAVSFINREVSGLRPDVLERKLTDPKMGAQERALWNSYLAGDFDAFAQGLKKLADEVQDGVGAPDNVVAIR